MLRLYIGVWGPPRFDPQHCSFRQQEIWSFWGVQRTGRLLQVPLQRHKERRIKKQSHRNLSQWRSSLGFWRRRYNTEHHWRRKNQNIANCKNFVTKPNLTLVQGRWTSGLYRKHWGIKPEGVNILLSLSLLKESLKSWIRYLPVQLRSEARKVACLGTLLPLLALLCLYLWISAWVPARCVTHLVNIGSPVSGLSLWSDPRSEWSIRLLLSLPFLVFSLIFLISGSRVTLLHHLMPFLTNWTSSKKELNWK